jgi:hypothetical protein
MVYNDYVCLDDNYTYTRVGVPCMPSGHATTAYRCCYVLPWKRLQFILCTYRTIHTVQVTRYTISLSFFCLWGIHLERRYFRKGVIPLTTSVYRNSVHT